MQQLAVVVVVGVVFSCARNLFDTIDTNVDNVLKDAGAFWGTVVSSIAGAGGGGTHWIPLGALKSATGALSEEKSVKSICHKEYPGTAVKILAVRTGMAVSIKVLKLYSSPESQYFHSSHFIVVPLCKVMSSTPW